MLRLAIVLLIAGSAVAQVAEGGWFGRGRWGPPDRVGYVMAASGGKVWVRDANEGEDVCLGVAVTRRNRLENLRFGSRYGLHVRKGVIVNFDRKRGRQAQQGPHDVNPCLPRAAPAPARQLDDGSDVSVLLARWIRCLTEARATRSEFCAVTDDELRDFCHELND